MNSPMPTVYVRPSSAGPHSIASIVRPPRSEGNATVVMPLSESLTPTQLANIGNGLRGALADAYHAGRADMATLLLSGPDADSPLLAAVLELARLVVAEGLLDAAR